MTSGGKCVFPSLDFKINQIPQQLIFPESKINFSGAEGGARVLVGGPHTSSFHGAGGRGGVAASGGHAQAQEHKLTETVQGRPLKPGRPTLARSPSWGRRGGVGAGASNLAQAQDAGAAC